MKYKGVKTESITGPVFQRKVYGKWWQFWKPKFWLSDEQRWFYDPKIDNVIQTSPKVVNTYYEKAFDSQGNGLKIGDRVKVTGSGDNQIDLVGQIKTVCGIFEGDLMLKNQYSYDYCWPYKVILIVGKRGYKIKIK